VKTKVANGSNYLEDHWWNDLSRVAGLLDVCSKTEFLVE